MEFTIDPREFTDRVLGRGLPRTPARIRQSGRSARPVGPILVLISAMTSAASLGLWAAGQGEWAMGLFGGTILLLATGLRSI